MAPPPRSMIVDEVVDDYGPVIVALEQEIAELEADVFSDERATPSKLIDAKKREVLKLKPAIACSWQSRPARAGRPGDVPRSCARTFATSRIT